MQREEALQSPCQFVNDVLTLEIIQPYQMIVEVLADWAADAQQAQQRRI
jgi:hypothetical protein